VWQMATGNWCKGFANSLEKSINEGFNSLSPLFKNHPLFSTSNAPRPSCPIWNNIRHTLWKLNILGFLWQVHCAVQGVFQMRYTHVKRWLSSGLLRRTVWKKLVTFQRCLQPPPLALHGTTSRHLLEENCCKVVKQTQLAEEKLKCKIL
jgi:hypothetical protein